MGSTTNAGPRHPREQSAAASPPTRRVCANSEADVVITSLVDPPKTMIKNFNETDNAPVLNFLVRHFLEDNRFLTI
jgi:hypothetical protein